MDEVLAAVTEALEKQRLVIENGALHEEVRLAEERYRTITENMSDTVWVMDLDFKTTYISPSVTTAVLRWRSCAFRWKAHDAGIVQEASRRPWPKK